jgi:hypothetical protein
MIIGVALKGGVLIGGSGGWCRVLRQGREGEP